MAELEGSTTVAPGAPSSYAITVAEFDAAGKKSVISVSLAPDATLDTIKRNLLLRACILKSTTWNKYNIPVILHAIMFADSLGLSIELGDVYTTDGRPAINAEGRIKLAQRDPRYRGHKTTFREIERPLPKGMEKCVLANELECTVQVFVDGWQEPITRVALLSRWWKNTPAWNERPEHQLELNTLGHACRFLGSAAIGDPDDAPTAEAVPAMSQASRSVSQS